MIYREVKGNLFDVGPEYFLVHCISADFKMGLGIAKTFADLGCREEVLKKTRTYYWQSVGNRVIWTAIPLDIEKHPKGVYHLVTKEKYFHKPTYQDVFDALYDLKHFFLHDGDKIAMPKIGCGLDKLEWSRVRKIIFQLFKEKDVEILICSLK